MRYFNTEPDGKCYRYRHRTKRVEEIISVALWCSRKKIKKNKKAKKPELPTITRLFTPSISLLRYTRALKLVVNNQVYEFEKKVLSNRFLSTITFGIWLPDHGFSISNTFPQDTWCCNNNFQTWFYFLPLGGNFAFPLWCVSFHFHIYLYLFSFQFYDEL